MESNKIRQAFLDFFAGKDHVIVPSAPMVVKNDPTLMFTNAGMNQFKDIFLGNIPRPYPRAADTQKCLRVSGKHNDLEEVGHDTYHHTMFEMLGNWSFGDYFKREAIGWAWELLTGVYGLDKSRMYATVFEGSEQDGVPFDREAYDYWLQYLPEDHIIRGNRHDNFWEMGETGPCGPCSEIHYDLRDEEEIRLQPGRELVNQGSPLVIEIWNLVFSQFDADGKGHYERLARPNIDTGMGLERLACVMQGVGNLFEVDTVQSVLHHVEHIAGKTYKQDPKTDISIRVITDHIRSCTFMVSDGILPSNEGRGYVLRRLLRRAARHGRMLGISRPFLVELVETVIQSSESAYPELREHDAYIKKVIGTEEANFARTIDAGMNILNNMIDGLEKAHQHLLKGLDVFKLNDTFGFPLDLTKEIAAEQGIEIDEEGFHAEMTKQKERARAERLKKNISGWSEDLFLSLIHI